MYTNEVLRIVEEIHRVKNIDREVVFQAIEAGLAAAAMQGHGAGDIAVTIDRKTGEVRALGRGVPLDPNAIVAAIGAQTVKEIIIQKIRAAECR